MKTVISIETYDGKEYAATTNSLRGFNSFSKAADRLREYGNKHTEGDDFVCSVGITAYDEDNLTHKRLEGHNLVITKDSIKGTFKEIK